MYPYEPYLSRKKIYCIDTKEMVTGIKYCNSKHWKNLKEKVYRHYRGMCQRCGEYLPFEEMVVHHRLYKRLGCEKMKDMVLYCKSCHSFVHALKEEFATTDEKIEKLLKNLTMDEKREAFDIIISYFEMEDFCIESEIRSIEMQISMLENILEKEIEGEVLRAAIYDDATFDEDLRERNSVGKSEIRRKIEKLKKRKKEIIETADRLRILSCYERETEDEETEDDDVRKFGENDEKIGEKTKRARRKCREKFVKVFRDCEIEANNEMEYEERDYIYERDRENRDYEDCFEPFNSEPFYEYECESEMPEVLFPRLIQHVDK